MTNVIKVVYNVGVVWYKKKHSIKLLFIGTVVAFFILYHINNYYVDEKKEYDRIWFFNVVPANLSIYPVTNEKTCHCKRPFSIDFVSDHPIQNFTQSTCDIYASQRGPHQKVVSYSFYGNITSPYFTGVAKNVEQVTQLYPGWVMRVYHGVDTHQPKNLAALCKLWCKYPQLDMCQVGALPRPLGDQSRIHGMVWRFFVLGKSALKDIWV